MAQLEFCPGWSSSFFRTRRPYHLGPMPAPLPGAKKLLGAPGRAFRQRISCGGSVPTACWWVGRIRFTWPNPLDDIDQIIAQDLGPWLAYRPFFPIPKKPSECPDEKKHCLLSGDLPLSVLKGPSNHSFQFAGAHSLVSSASYPGHTSCQTVISRRRVFDEHPSRLRQAPSITSSQLHVDSIRGKDCCSVDGWQLRVWMDAFPILQVWDKHNQASTRPVFGIGGPATSLRSPQKGGWLTPKFMCNLSQSKKPQAPLQISDVIRSFTPTFGCHNIVSGVILAPASNHQF